MIRLRDLPLRDRKYAQNKHNLLMAAMEHLKEKRFEDISIKELCQEALVSEATFFNYFPKKSNLLLYYSALWSIELVWHSRRLAPPGSGIGLLETIFDYTAEKMEAHPRAMMELIAFKARMEGYPQPLEITLAERLTAFPDMEGVEDIPSRWLDSIFLTALRLAEDNGELPRGSDLNAILMALLSAYYGIPLVSALIAPGDIHGQYQSQLKMLWAAVAAMAG